MFRRNVRQIRRRRPGVTALATTAVLATGWPITPTRPMRAGLMGMSCSFGDVVVGFDRRDDRLDRDAAVGDQLSTGAARCGCERGGPQVLPDQHTCDGARIH